MIAKLTLTCSLLAIIHSAIAQTPPGFEPKVDETLQLSFGGKDVAAAGDKVAQADATAPPNISGKFEKDPKGVMVMLDLDVDKKGNQTLLHWMSSDVDLKSTPVKVPANKGAAYWPPSPPAGDGPHRYVVVVFPQPDKFALPAQYSNIKDLNDRMAFSLPAFTADAKLDPPLAANYITVQNGTFTSTTSGTATSTTAASKTAASATEASQTADVMTSATSEGGASMPFVLEWGFLAAAGLFAALA